MELAGQNTAVHVEFATVRRPAELSRILGADVHGFKHGISNQALKHMRDRHPDLTRADFARLPDIVAVGRAALGKDRGLNGVPRVIYRASIGGKHYEYVAEYRRRKKRLDAITLYQV